MDKKWITAIVLAIVVLAAAVAVVAITGDKSGNGDDGDGTITVTDGIGRTVTLPEDIETVSSCSNVVASILCGIGASDNIVAVSVDEGAYTDFDFVIGLVDDDYPQAIIDGLADGSIKNLGGMYNMSSESALSVTSDLKIFTEYGYDPDTGAALDKLGVPYIVLKNEDSIETVYSNIALLGKVMDREDAASELVSQMKDIVNKIKTWCASVSSGNKVSAATFMGTSYACGDLYIKGAILKDIGAVNPFSDLGKYAQVSSEAIADKDPDVLIYTNVSMGSGNDSSTFLDEFLNDPVLGSTTAAENNNVYVVDGEKTDRATCTNSHQMLNAYALWAMCIYSDYLPFEMPNIITDDVFEDLIDQFWETIN
ncbi:ABC transporter substrate-binding protein [Candidatus Methanoprimaticola sp. MG2]|uniref:ABC transporter substrate-binding protein n=1 Tax=Candidatus Methanoprimaticola sp. MG2 TaxID=3228838 RepID=UPI0039C6CF17